MVCLSLSAGLLRFLRWVCGEVFDGGTAVQVDAPVGTAGDEGEGGEEAGHLFVAWEGTAAVNAEELEDGLAAGLGGHQVEVRLVEDAKGRLVRLGRVADWLAADGLELQTEQVGLLVGRAAGGEGQVEVCHLAAHRQAGARVFSDLSLSRGDLAETHLCVEIAALEGTATDP